VGGYSRFGIIPGQSAKAGVFSGMAIRTLQGKATKLAVSFRHGVESMALIILQGFILKTYS
jgi:hypothetical protein